MKYNVPNLATFDAMMKCEQVLGTMGGQILVSISGGADSDVMLDFIYRQKKEKDFDCEIHYVFFDTGIELQATKEHLDYLEKKYNIKIERVRAKVPVPLGCIKYGIPFLSKDVSSKINSLQNNNFDFANDGNKTFEYLIAKYPNCKASIKWWCNKKPKGFGINANFLLKQFMIEYPPTFKISSRCCEGAKKTPSHEYENAGNFNVKCLGLRKAEGGIRSTKIKNCFTDKGKIKEYRPIFWFSDKDKKEYETFYNVVHSRCYTEYGFKRTGCCGCPFNSKFDEDLEKIKDKEPLLYQAVNNIFGASYEYTRRYREFKKLKKDGIIDGQQDLFNLLKGEIK